MKKYDVTIISGVCFLKKWIFVVARTVQQKISALLVKDIEKSVTDIISSHLVTPTIAAVISGPRCLENTEYEGGID